MQSLTPKKTVVLLLSLVLIAYVGCGRESTPPVELGNAELLAKIDALVEEVMERDRVVGTSIGVKKGGEILVAKGFGYADLENEVEATERTVYRIGSITKQFTALAIMMLAEQGKISLDDDLTKFVPDYPSRDHAVTIDRLLNHTSGIKGYTEMKQFWSEARLDLSHEETIDMFSAAPFEFAPGEKYQYNNSAYYLLGVIIEKVSGMSYADFLKENIWAPLGLKETHYLDNAPIIKNRAEGYEVRDENVVNDDLLSMKTPFSAGALGSSVTDLLEWQMSLMENRLVSRDSYGKMTTPATLNDGSKTTYGYGLTIGNLEGRRKISHGGGINGFTTQLSYYPDEDLTIVVLCNSGSANPGALESRIARAVLEIPEKTVDIVSLEEEELEVYAGVYDAGRRPITVSIEDGALTAMGSRLRPVGNHQFLPAGDDYRVITFTVEDGRAVSLRIEREGHVTEASRLESS
jgi:CubicO group peptidase (beta-lactamase class C family)